MIDFLAQLDYLRDVQRAFGSGPERLDVLGIFTKMLSVAGPVVMVMALWYYRHEVLFALLRFIGRLVSSSSQSVIENYLVTKGILLDVYFYSSDGVGRKLCNARVTDVVDGKMVLQLVNINPTSLNLKKHRIICFTKPFTYNGHKINAFITFAGHVKKRGSVIKELSLYTPIRYRFIVRRIHERQAITREGTVRVKAWDGRKRKTFWMARPDMQTVNNPAKYSEKMRLSVENISAGGMRLLIMHPKGQLPPLGVGHHLVLRVSVWSPQTKKFTYFNVVGTIRSRFKGKGGALGLGIQFTAHGEKQGSTYVWTALNGELKSLAQFLEKAQQ